MSDFKIIKDRAQTDEQKRECVELILEYWKQFPDMRLGQLIENAIVNHAYPMALKLKLSPALFYIEDYKLIAQLKEFIEWHKKEDPNV